MNSKILVSFYYVDENVQENVQNREDKYNVVPLKFDSANKILSLAGIEWQQVIDRTLTVIQDPTLNIELDSSSSQDIDSKRIIILLVHSKQLADQYFLDYLPSSYRHTAGNTLRKVVSPLDRHKKAVLDYHPIITISQHDLPYLVSELRILDEKPIRPQPKHLKYDPRALFLDASIWHRYVPMLPFDQQDTFESVLKETLSDMIGYWEDGLYYTVAGVSTLEFQLRMLRHSFIGKFGDKGHEDMVTPFKFYSERVFKHKFKEDKQYFVEKKWNEKSLFEVLKWRILIVDDNTKPPISTIAEGKKCTVSKETLICRPFESLYKEVGLTITYSNFQMESPPEEGIVGYCLTKMKNTSFDLIFLDYLLGARTDGRSGREYGDRFLQELIKDNSAQDTDLSDQTQITPQYRRDFQGKYWIFPISSFPYALPDRLTQLGISHLHSIWHLSQGSDPITTPHAYAYFLLRFMKQKVRDYFLDPRALELIFNQVPERLKADDVESRKRWAGYLRDALQQYESKMNLLKRQKFDNDHDSLFAQSILSFTQEQTFLISLIKIFNQILDDILTLNGGLRESTLVKVKDKLSQKMYEPFQKIIDLFLYIVSGFRLADLESVEKVSIFVAYASDDKAYVDNFMTNCATLIRQYDIDIWHKGLMFAGDHSLEIELRFDKAHIYLFMVTQRLMNSEEIITKQLPKAHKKSIGNTPQAVLIPIRVEPADIQDTLLDKEGALPINQHSTPDDKGFWLEIVNSIRKTIDNRFPGVKRVQL